MMIPDQQSEQNSEQPAAKQTILAVDDTPENLDVINGILTPKYMVKAAINGPMALKIVSAKHPDLILLDIMMPKMDGYEVCRRLKEESNTKNIPVVFITAKSKPEDFAKGLEVGAFYYLTKPVEPNALKSVVASALSHHKTQKTLNDETSQALGSISSIKKGEFQFRTLSEARNLAILIANAYPDPNIIVMGLTELFLNALEHGNLGISYDEKTVLNKNGTWESEVNRRQSLPENAEKFVNVDFKRSKDEIQILICDQGPGFDWQDYMEFNVKRALDNHGRGILMANKMSFDQMEYRGIGNEVLATVRLKE